MIARLSGTLLDKQVQRLIIDVGGVGYEVWAPLSTFYAVGEPGASVAVHVHTHVREDTIQLFGFHTALELLLFERLISISGVGPKVALAVLSGIEPGELVRAIRGADLARLVRIPGVGRRTAERLVVELKDRLPDDLAGPADAAAAGVPGSAERDDVISALVNLGYQRAAVERAMAAVEKDGEVRGFEPLLRDVLKKM
jgi:Holliday junction DNA helicase RuvA